MEYIKLAGVIVLVILLCTAALTWVVKGTQKVFLALEAAEKEARAVKDEAQLHAAMETLREVSKECWHRTLGAEVRKIYTILEVKAEIMGVRLKYKLG